MEDLPKTIDKDDRDDHFALIESTIPAVFGADVIQTVGQGGQGRALLIESKETKEQLVAKVYASIRIARNEVRAFELIGKHQNIVNLLQFREGQPDPRPQGITLILEYCDLGDLLSWKKDALEEEEPIDEAFIWHVLLSLSSAFAFLHWGHGTD